MVNRYSRFFVCMLFFTSADFLKIMMCVREILRINGIDIIGNTKDVLFWVSLVVSLAAGLALSLWFRKMHKNFEECGDDKKDLIFIIVELAGVLAVYWGLDELLYYLEHLQK